MAKAVDAIKIKIEKHKEKYIVYPVGLENVISVEGATREEAIEKVESAIRSHAMVPAEEPHPEYPKHIVAVMGIVRNSKGQILLVQVERRGWEPPGGQVEVGEDILTALRREVLEESGIKIKTGKLLAVYSNVMSEPTKLMLTFEASSVGGRLRTSEETLDVGWFSPEEAVEKVTHPAQKHKLQDALAGSEGIIYRVYGNYPYKLLKTTIV